MIFFIHLQEQGRCLHTPLLTFPKPLKGYDLWEGGLEEVELQKE